MIEFVKTVVDSLKEFSTHGNQNDELRRFFMNEYKAGGKEAYLYWLNTNNENFYS